MWPSCGQRDIKISLLEGMKLLEKMPLHDKRDRHERDVYSLASLIFPLSCLLTLNICVISGAQAWGHKHGNEINTLRLQRLSPCWTVLELPASSFYSKWDNLVRVFCNLLLNITYLTKINFPSESLVCVDHNRLQQGSKVNILPLSTAMHEMPITLLDKRDCTGPGETKSTSKTEVQGYLDFLSCKQGGTDNPYV